MIGFSTAFHHREARCAKPQPMGPDKSNGGWEAEGAKTGHRPAAGLSDPLPKIPPTSPGFSKAHELDLAPWSLKKKRGLFSAPLSQPEVRGLYGQTTCLLLKCLGQEWTAGVDGPCSLSEAPFSAGGTVRFQLFLPGPNWARKKQKGLSCYS